jgi:predicted DCC family thiol-disulfide oxidoreductase YuxK
MSGQEIQYPITIFYDGACGICRREMERYKAKDKEARLKFVNVNRPDFKPENEGVARNWFAARNVTTT